MFIYIIYRWFHILCPAIYGFGILQVELIVDMVPAKPECHQDCVEDFSLFIHAHSHSFFYRIGVMSCARVYVFENSLLLGEKQGMGRAIPSSCHVLSFRTS